MTPEERFALKQKFLRMIWPREFISCTRCGHSVHIDEKGKHLQAEGDVHHIHPVGSHPELAGDLGNTTWLCRTCHSRSHRGEKNENDKT